MLQVEVLDWKINPNRDMQGVILKASVAKVLGTMTITLIQKRIIWLGDSFVAGAAAGKAYTLIEFD